MSIILKYRIVFLILIIFLSLFLILLLNLFMIFQLSVKWYANCRVQVIDCLGLVYSLAFSIKSILSTTGCHRYRSISNNERAYIISETKFNQTEFYSFIFVFHQSINLFHSPIFCRNRTKMKIIFFHLYHICEFKSLSTCNLQK